MEAQLAALVAKVDAGFASEKAWRDDRDRVSSERHEENVERLDRLDARTREIELEVKKTNGRVNQHDKELAGLWRRSDRASGKAPEARGFSMRDARMVGLGGGGLIAAWKFVEWAFHLLKSLP